MLQQSNILDPIHDELDPRVWDDPANPQPKLKTQHTQWIKRTINEVLEKHYERVDEWLSLVFTGSLTTYQYSDESDVDVSLFVDVNSFPEWDRAEMIGIVVESIDGTILPGTPFPLQAFVVPKGIEKQSLYRPGLRSGYDLNAEAWVVPPEHDRVHDVEQEYNAYYVYALETADKMERLLRYEPDKAIMFWHQIHKRRQRDQRAGKGDYAESNVAYKMLANRGLFPTISEVSGEYIARQKRGASSLRFTRKLSNGPIRAILQKFDSGNVHPGNQMPFIYVPKLSTVFVGPVGAYHWQLIRKTPELREAYGTNENFMAMPPAALVPENIHGALDPKSALATFYGEMPSPEDRQRIAEAMGAKDKASLEQRGESWKF